MRSSNYHGGKARPDFCRCGNESCFNSVGHREEVQEAGTPSGVPNTSALGASKHTLSYAPRDIIKASESLPMTSVTISFSSTSRNRSRR